MTEGVQRTLFTERVGATLEVRGAGGGAVELRVDGVEDHGAADGTRFSVFLSGPVAHPLGQGVHAVAVPGDDPFPLFLVPVALEEGRYVYEASFNREGG